jgi:hypothetical protein
MRNLPRRLADLPSIPPALRTWLHRFGFILSVAGVLFVILKLLDHKNAILEANLSAKSIAAMSALAAIAGFSNILLALGWRDLLAALNVAVRLPWAIWAYAVSQLAKYVPGNIFQFAGRQALGLAAGLPGWPLAISAAWEIALLALCGAGYGLLLLPLLTPLVSGTGAALAFTVAAIAMIIVASVTRWKDAALAIFCYLAFLGVAGLLFAALLVIAGNEATVLRYGILTVVSAYVVAWLVGLLTPGAPAGVGVREATLLLLLGDANDTSTLPLAVLLARIVTVTGDLLFYASSYLIRSRTA